MFSIFRFEFLFFCVVPDNFFFILQNLKLFKTELCAVLKLKLGKVTVLN